MATAVSDLEPTGPVRIVCGKGNNGGDGLVAARRLAELGIEAEALLLCPPAESSADARANYERLTSAGGAVSETWAPAICRPRLRARRSRSTGFSGPASAEPRARRVDQAIAAINAAGCPVVAVDVPSGVDASTGEVAGACVQRRHDRHVPRREAGAVDQCPASRLPAGSR